MRKEIMKAMPQYEIICDICGMIVDKEHRHTVRGKDIVLDYHNSCLVNFLLEYAKANPKKEEKSK